MLFNSINRTNLDYKKRSEKTYEFLNNSAWKISEFSRNIFEDFADEFIVDAEFLKMFKSESDKQHNSAVFELLIYAALKKSNLKLEKHPISKTGRRPDFQITYDEDYKFYLECTLSGDSFENEDEKKRRERIEEIIDELYFFPYWINIHFITISLKSISKKRLLQFIQKIKDTCDIYSNEELSNVTFEFNDNDWLLGISLLRKADPKIKRSLGIISGGSKIIDKSKSILTALNDKKAAKYGVENEPYVICVSINDMSISEKEIAEILFGQYNTDIIDLVIANNAFWISNCNPINSRVSAIIFCKNFDLFILQSTEISVWHNPFAKNKLKYELLPFDEYIFKKSGNILSRSIIKKATDIFEILNINKSDYMSMDKKSGS